MRLQAILGFLRALFIVGTFGPLASGQTALAGDQAAKDGKAEATVAGIDATAQKPGESANDSKSDQKEAIKTPRATAESQAKQKLQEARQALTGKEKNLSQAERIMTDLANSGTHALSPMDRCHLYVYLGYVEDLRQNREAAIRWFEKGAALDGPNIEAIRAVAKAGLSQPVTWLRHLDSQAPAPSSLERKGRTPERPRKGILTYETPREMPDLKKDLSAAERLENFDILWETIDEKYSFFDHKSIDWQAVKTRYRPKVAAASSADNFYRVLFDLMRELKDAHSYLCNYKVDLLRFSPGVCTSQIEGKAVVIYVVDGSEAFAKRLRPGAIITRIDGQSVAQKVEQLRGVMPASSSERHFVAAAYECLLHGEKDSTVNVTFLPPGTKVAVKAVLQRTVSMPSRHQLTGFRLEKGKFVWSGTHPLGYGYIRIVSFSGHEEIADEFDRALEKLKNSPALLIDIRDNPGGSGAAQIRIIGRLITAKAKVGTSFRKNGAGHQDFANQESSISPAGDWQYTKPIALLTNINTGSASDLFTCRMRGTGRAVTVGTTTHGNLSGVSAYVTLPCGLVARVSDGYIADVDGRIIEVNGNVPQIHAEPTLKDVVNGTDPVMDRAVQALREAERREQPPGGKSLPSHNR